MQFQCFNTKLYKYSILYFIMGLFKKFKIKKGALSKQVEIPEKKDIPLTLLRKIVKTKTNEKLKNPTKSGKKRMKATRLLKKRAQFALNMKVGRKQNK